MQRIKISDGLNFNYEKMDKFKTNFFEVCFVLDLERENTTKLSLLSGVLTRASEHYPSVAKINDRCDYLYDMNVSMRTFNRGERLILSYECDFLKNEFLPEGSEDLLCEAVEMFRELVFCPFLVNGVFDKKNLDIEKTELTNSIKALINNKNAYVREKCTERLCEGERYSISPQGNLEDIEKVTPENLYEFYKELLECAVVEIFFAGNADIDKTAKMFGKVFEKVQRNPKELCTTLISGKARENVLELSESMEVSQGKLALGFKTGVGVNDKDSIAMTVMCEIFGGSPMSKLFMNVREKLSLCYYCRSIADSYKGIMFVLSGIQSENKDKSQNAILKELSDICEGKISDEEFEAAKLSLINSYKTLDDNPSSLALWYVSRILCENYLTPDEVVKQIQNLTKQQVSLVAKKVKLDTVYFLKSNE